MARLSTKVPRTSRAAIKPPATAKPKSAAASYVAAPHTRRNTKQAKLIAMLRRPSGATIDAMVKATGWQRHTVRGSLSGALKKRLGLTVTSETVKDRERVYRPATAGKIQDPRDSDDESR